MDWDLLRRGAAGVARAINICQATAAIVRSASELSRRLRLRVRRIVAALNQLGLSEVNDLLDRRGFGG